MGGGGGHWWRREGGLYRPMYSFIQQSLFQGTEDGLSQAGQSGA